MHIPGSKLYIGVDEAGYGPNLGPLVVAASVWQAPAECSESAFAKCLAPWSSPAPWTLGCSHVPLGDSKMLYRSGSGLSTLEAGLLSMQMVGQDACRTLGELLAQFSMAQPSSETTQAPSQDAVWLSLEDQLLQHPWYVGFDSLPVPVHLPSADEAARLADLARCRLAGSGLSLVETHAVVVTERQFNAAVDRWGSKGQLLSQVSLELVARILRNRVTDVEVFCDRQGGRKNYLPNLAQVMPDQWFRIQSVEATRSSYRNSHSPSIEIHFSVGGDRFPPTALASMIPKYIRERLMEQLNQFWRGHLPELRPTAGYPQDARRFRQAIAPVAKRLAIAPERWWRCR